jgi:hypothetical protein
MKFYAYVLVAISFLSISACEQKPNLNRTDGIKDALDARPNEGIRDAGEQVGGAIKDAGHNLKDAVKSN